MDGRSRWLSPGLDYCGINGLLISVEWRIGVEGRGWVFSGLGGLSFSV